MAKEKKKKFGKKVAVTIVCGVLCGGMLAAAPAGYRYWKEYRTQKAEQESNKQDSQTTDQAENVGLVQENDIDENRISSVYDVSVVWDNVIPSMVVIDTKTVMEYQFFGRVYEQESQESGSGIIIAQADELFLVTNHHVVDGATAIQVTFVDGSSAPAKVKGSDAREDIAVLTVDFSDLKKETLEAIRIATVGDSEHLKSGEMVIAIGNAAGGGQSLSVGYVSALDREIEIEGVTMNLIQTDAAINPGNSGGALLDATGALVGINNAKLVANEVEGIGYAIPISKVLSLINRLVNREEISYRDSAKLEFEGQDVTEALSSALSIPMGVYVAAYEEDSALAEAGVPLFSVITEVNGIEVKSMEQLEDALRYTRGGTTGTLIAQVRIEGVYVPKEYTVTFEARK